MGLLCSLFIFFLINNPYGSNIQKSFNNTQNENHLQELGVKTSAPLAWYQLPTLSNKYFSPDSTPGYADTTTYSFSITQDCNYTLNISAYYDPINTYFDEFGGIKPIEYWNSSAYYTQNGTWIIALHEPKDPILNIGGYLTLGIGTNASNIEWQRLGEVNMTEYVAIAADESGRIRVAYTEDYGVDTTPFWGIKYFASDNWAKDWTNGTLFESTNSWRNNGKYYGLSVGEFGGNFTYVWSLSNLSSTSTSTIWVCQEDPIDSVWTIPKNLTALEGYFGTAPQLFYNRTNNNGSIFLAFNHYIPSWGYMNMTILQLGRDIDSSIHRSWNLTYSRLLKSPIESSSKPLVYCTKDAITNAFYFIDYTKTNFANNFDLGIQNTTWGKLLNSSKVDLFQVDFDYGFNFYANNSRVRCYSDHATFENGIQGPGILDCEMPFNVINKTGELESYLTFSYEFNGTDGKGYSRKAQAYSFNLYVDNGTDWLSHKTNVYVDNIPAIVGLTHSEENISPFQSFGEKDEFNLNIESDKAGTLDFSVQSNTFVSSVNNFIFTNNIEYPCICSDGNTSYIFYCEYATPVYNLMFSKSIDGGLSWSNPELIKSKTGTSNVWGRLNAISNNSDVILWTQVGGVSKQNPTIFQSTDAGDSFVELQTEYSIHAASEDFTCWRGLSNGMDKFEINISFNDGLSWDSFVNVSLNQAGYYSLVDAAYDPQSGNYSFLIGNVYDYEILFLLVNYTGEEYSLSNNIILDGYTSGLIHNYNSQTKLDSKKQADNTYKWIVTTTARDSYNTNKWMTTLSYKESTNGVDFGSWQTLTMLNEDEIEAFAIGHWDIIYPQSSGQPSLVTGFVEGVTSTINELKTLCISNLVYRKEISLNPNSKTTITYNGITGSGIILDDGIYTWTMRVTDLVGYVKEFHGNLLIDNTLPVLVGDISYNTSKPFPNKNIELSILINDINAQNGYIEYRNPDSDWVKVNLEKIQIDNTQANYTAVIPVQPDNVSTVYWKAAIFDICGNSLLLDNGGQLYSYSKGIFEYSKQSGILSPTLYDDWTWTYIFTSGTDHIERVWIRATFDGINQTEQTLLPIDEFNTTYSIDIEHDITHENATYEFMFTSDEGNTYIIETIELSQPRIHIEQDTDISLNVDLNEQNTINVSFTVTEFENYLDYIQIKYEFNDGGGIKICNMTKASSSYKYTFTNFSSDCTELTFTVVGIDIYGQNISVDNNWVIQLKPALPIWEITPFQQLILSLAALIIGIACGIVYSYLIQRRSIEDKIREEILPKTMEKQSDDFKGDKKHSQIIVNRSKTLKEQKKKRIILLFVSLGFIAILTSAFISFYVFQNYYLAILLFTGSFLASVLLWVFLLNYYVEKVFSSPIKISLRHYQILILSFSILIYFTVIAIFLTGNFIAWWQVRVNELSYQFGELIIPRALTTVTTAFFSSILVLTFSTFRKLSVRDKELRKAEILNENPLDILERREQALTSTSRNVGLKGILFVAIIGITIIFASDLSIYATQGILIIVPFVIGAFGSLLVIMLIRKKKKPAEFSVIFDNMIECPKCGSETALGGNYCENCGKELMTRQHYDKSILCEYCKKYNRMGVSYCRYCGKEIKIEEQTKIPLEEESPSDTEETFLNTNEE